jgi:hypothetical protein
MRYHPDDRSSFYQPACVRQISNVQPFAINTEHFAARVGVAECGLNKGSERFCLDESVLE